MNTSTDIWIFGYGSLMWKPGFDFIQSSRAVLEGYHRDLCILSYIYRGTYECPGLVMGLNEGGRCVGRAFQVHGDKKQDVFEYLHEREMPNKVYKPQWVSLKLENQQEVQAYTFIADEEHAQHVGSKTLEEKIEIILQGQGTGGSALEYLENTIQQLKEWDMRDENLEVILAKTLKTKASNK